jgi:hypothetical protein
VPGPGKLYSGGPGPRRPGGPPRPPGRRQPDRARRGRRDAHAGPVPAGRLISCLVTWAKAVNKQVEEADHRGSRRRTAQHRQGAVRSRTPALDCSRARRCPASGRGRVRSSGLRAFLGSLDRFAGWLVADEHISRRGQALMRQTGHPATGSAPGTKPPVRPAHDGHIQPAWPAGTRQAGEQDQEMGAAIAADQGQQDKHRVRCETSGQVTTGKERATAGRHRPGLAPGNASVSSPAGRPDQPPRPARSMSGSPFPPMFMPAPWRCAESSTTDRLRTSGSNAPVTAPGRPPLPSRQAVATATGTCSMANAGRTPGRPTAMCQIPTAAPTRSSSNDQPQPCAAKHAEQKFNRPASGTAIMPAGSSWQTTPPS